ncbi:MAG: methylated-DNA--[protein]-cysteine S-methyltransferase [Candidatus Zipacnadales bacterium]
MSQPRNLATVFETSAGWVALARSEIGLCRCEHSQPTRESALSRLGQGWTLIDLQADPLFCRTASLLREYFAGKRVSFDLPLDLCSLPEFTRQVLLACHQIPPAETRSYGDLARYVGNPRAARAVGQALRRNPLPLIIPCHRVIGSDGSLVGFAGRSNALDLKRRLLDHEQATLSRSELPQTSDETNSLSR